MAPEIRPRCLQGKVYNDPEMPDGTMLMTGEVVNAKGRIITTSDGLVYKLGRIKPGYRKYLRKNKMPYSAERPIRVGKRAYAGGKA